MQGLVLDVVRSVDTLRMLGAARRQASSKTKCIKMTVKVISGMKLKMTVLNQDQTQRALEAMREYLAAPRNSEGKTPQEVQAERDEKRQEVIDQKLKALLSAYLSGKVPVKEFKSQVDGISKNKHGDYWGFRGIKGQMFFNMVVNTARDPKECDEQLKAALTVPADEQTARSRMRAFTSYVKKLGEQHLEKGGTKHERPKVGSVPFFLSYFWQIHDRSTWPVYYTNDVQVMEDLNLWTATDDLAENYIAFKHIHEELAQIFTKASGQRFGPYDVEHVFWLKGGNPYGASKSPSPAVSSNADGGPDRRIPLVMADGKLPESYVPRLSQSYRRWRRILQN